MENTSDLTAQLTYGTWRFQKNWKPLEIVDAEGCYFSDSSGKKYLDFSSQLMCCLLGHKNQAVIDAIANQAKRLAYIAPAFATEERAQLSKMLLDVLPTGLNRFFYTTSGTEANEAAFKIARMVTGKSRIISRYRSYHGSTMGSVAATGDFRRWYMEPASKIPNVSFAPEVDCYRCPLHHSYPDCKVACADYIEHILENESDVAAVIVEPVVGTNGVLIPPQEYLPRLREICTRHKVLLIADEVMSGWGRTGKWFAVDHWNIQPDILTTAKGITSAYVPLGLCATTSEIANHFNDNYFAHGHTYEAHPLTLGAAIASINEFKRLNLIDRAAELSSYMEGKLRPLLDRHPSVGDVRGIGLFWAVDLAKDRTTRAPFNTFKDKTANQSLVVDRVAAEMMKNGVYVVSWVNHFVIAPPLIITKQEIDQGVDAMDRALKIADDAM